MTSEVWEQKTVVLAVVKSQPIHLVSMTCILAKEDQCLCLPRMLIHPIVKATGALYFSVETMNT
jgi:hypothetical protein